jgi:hypothetical protein
MKIYKSKAVVQIQRLGEHEDQLKAVVQNQRPGEYEDLSKAVLQQIMG